ncbi:helix-turn-helix domain-containing protein [Jiulongibacter sp. NS-SX5]|uniref:helix-turn-helix domain-containing protein n=1 Tax=Jiulongibacter sp. NS-SX5 TaxID=3463854 RepID=UPI004058A047
MQFNFFSDRFSNFSTQLINVLISILAQNIEFLRKLQGLTQKDLGAELGMTRAAIDSYEGGRAVPPYEKLKTIAAYFEKSVGEITELKIWLEEEETPGSINFKAPAEESLKDEKEMNLQLPRENSSDEIPLVLRDELSDFVNNASFTVSGSINVPFRKFGEGQVVAFEAGNDFPIQGSLLIAQQLTNVKDCRDGQCYLVLTKEGELLYRKAYNQTSTRGMLVLTPEVTGMATIDMPLEDIHSVWQPISYIAEQMPEMRQDLSEIKKTAEQLSEQLKRFN